MGRLTAWKVFKCTVAISAGFGIGKRILMGVDAVMLDRLMRKYPELYKKVLEEKEK